MDGKVSPKRGVNSYVPKNSDDAINYAVKQEMEAI